MGDMDGNQDGENRIDQYFPLSMVRAKIAQKYTLIDSDYATGGPARYSIIQETNQRIGFITPMTHNFCESCNRVRLTCTGTLFLCLGQEDKVEFRDLLRSTNNDNDIINAINHAMTIKPKGHDFIIDRHSKEFVPRYMSTTGG